MEIRAYRHAAWDTPLWVEPNRRAGRFNEAGEGETQYLSLHPLGPWAELLRAEDLREPEEIEQLRVPLWALRVFVDEAGPLQIDFDNADEWDLKPEDLVSDDHTACRRLASEIRAAPGAPQTLIVPSAALPGTENLVILGPRVRVRFMARPLDEVDLPLSLVVDEGHPPRGLADLVHHRGSSDPHPALEAWERGDAFTFEEPSPGTFTSSSTSAVRR